VGFVPPLCREDIPDELASWLPSGAELAFPEQGMTSAVAFAVPGNAVLKRCTDPRYLDWLRREQVVLKALEETGLAVPRCLDALDLGAEVWLVMTRLRGHNATDVLRETTPQARVRIMGEVGVYLRQLHNTAVPQMLQSETEWVTGRLRQARANLAWCDGSSALLDQLEQTRPDAVNSVLVHGDLNLDNLLLDGNGVCGLVDWAAGGAGDARYDVGLVLQRNEESVLDDAAIAAFFEGYGTEVDLDARRWFEDLYEFF